MKLGNIVKSIFVTTAIFVSIICAFTETFRSGLEIMFLVPFVYGITTIIFMKGKYFEDGGFGLKIFLPLMWIRYVIMPLFVALSEGQFNKLVGTSSNAYFISIFVMIAENLTIYYTIHYNKKRLSNQNDVLAKGKGPEKRSVSLLGWSVIILIIFILAIRRFEFLNTARFGIVNMDKYWDLYSVHSDEYGVVLFEGFRYALYALILRWGCKKYEKKPKFIYFLLPAITGGINILLYFGYNRAQIVITSVMIIVTLFKEFPRYRRLILTFIIPIALLIIASMIFTKNFNMSLSSVGDSNSQMDNSITKISNTIESYFNGFWPLANGIDSIKVIRNMAPIYAIFADYYINTIFSIIPGISIKFHTTETTIGIYNMYLGGGGAMLPMSIQGMYYFSVFGIMIVNILMPSILIKLDDMFKKESRIEYKCLLTTLITPFALSPCYALTTHVYLITRAPAVMFMIIYLSNIHIKNKLAGVYE